MKIKEKLQLMEDIRRKNDESWRIQAMKLNKGDNNMKNYINDTENNRTHLRVTIDWDMMKVIIEEPGTGLRTVEYDFESPREFGDILRDWLQP